MQRRGTQRPRRPRSRLSWRLPSRSSTRSVRAKAGALRALRSTSFSEPAGAYREALLPCSPWWHVLQFLVDAALRQIQRIGDAGHRLEADEVPSLRSVHDRGAVVRAEHDV